MKYIVATSFRVTARFEIDAEYPSAAEEQAEETVRSKVLGSFPRCGVAFDSTEVNSEDE